jgi:hypothetical protein
MRNLFIAVVAVVLASAGAVLAGLGREEAPRVAGLTLSTGTTTDETTTVSAPTNEATTAETTTAATTTAGTTTAETTTAGTTTAEDVSGPCDEPEHANDPRCTGAGGDDDRSGPNRGRDGRGGDDDRSGSNSGRDRGGDRGSNRGRSGDG